MRTLASYISIVAFGLIFVSILALGNFTPKIAQADCVETPDSGQYCLLEPLPIGNGQVYDKYDPSVTTASDYINLIIKVFISIIGALGVIMIVLGGVQYMTTDAISKKEGGKEMITNAIFGLILALVSWLLLNTINPHLVEIRLEPPKGSAITVDSTADLPSDETTLTGYINGQNVSIKTRCNQTSVNAAAADGVALKDGEAWGTVAKIKASDDFYRQKLSAAGISVNHPTNCTKVGELGCTSVYKLGDAVVETASKLRSSVCASNGGNCSIIITGGTECWLHSSHQIGSGNFDLSATPELDTYIKNAATRTCRGWIKTKSSDGCPMGQAGSYTIDGHEYIRESDHYHVAH